MTRRSIGVMLAAAAMGVTACGGSSKKSTTAAQTTTTQAAVTSTPTTTTAPAKHKIHHAAAKKPKHVVPPPKASTTTAPSSTQPPGKTTVSGPSPISCLKKAGLIAATSTGANRWNARNAATLKQVFVDGPYKNKAAAQAAAQSLNGIETAKAGGLYMVSAILTAHLDATVTSVANCLSPSNGSGNLSF